MILPLGMAPRKETHRQSRIEENDSLRDRWKFRGCTPDFLYCPLSPFPDLTCYILNSTPGLCARGGCEEESQTRPHDPSQQEGQQDDRNPSSFFTHFPFLLTKSWQRRLVESIQQGFIRLLALQYMIADSKRISKTPPKSGRVTGCCITRMAVGDRKGQGQKWLALISKR
jgi:hypothetical protein